MKTAKATKPKKVEAIALGMTADFHGKLKFGRFVTPRWFAEAKKRRIASPGDVVEVAGLGNRVVETVRIFARKLAYGFEGVERPYGADEVTLVACDPFGPATVGDYVTFVRDGGFASGWVTWAGLRTGKVTVLRDQGREAQATDRVEGFELDHRYDGKHFAGVDGWCRQTSDNIAQGPHAPRAEQPQRAAAHVAQDIPLPRAPSQAMAEIRPAAPPRDVRIAPFASAKSLRDVPAPAYRPKPGGIAAQARSSVRRVPLSQL